MNPLPLMYAATQMYASAHAATWAWCWFAWSPGPYGAQRRRGENNVVRLEERKRA